MNKVNTPVSNEHDNDSAYTDVTFTFKQADDLYRINQAAREAHRFYSLNEGAIHAAINKSGAAALPTMFATSPQADSHLNHACDHDHGGVLNEWRDVHLPCITRIESPAAVSWRLQIYLDYLKDNQLHDDPTCDWPQTVEELYAVARHHYIRLLRLGYMLPQRLMPSDAVNHETHIDELIRACMDWSYTDHGIDPAPLERYREEMLRRTVEFLSHTQRRLLIELTEDLQLASDLAIRIGKGANVTGEVDRSTATRCLKDMEKQGIVKRPAGERKGWAYTDFGRDLQAYLEENWLDPEDR